MALPNERFALPILRFIHEMGVNGATDEQICDYIEQHVELTNYERELAGKPSPEPRWRKTVRKVLHQMAASKLVAHGAAGESMSEDEPPKSRIAEGGDASADDEMRWGGGFRDPVRNREIERAAVHFVTALYGSRGWSVRPVESDKCGFDLLCWMSDAEEHVEVKGVGGELQSFFITKGELDRINTDSLFVLYVVTGATTKSPKYFSYRGEDVLAQFQVEPVQYRLTHRPKR